MTRHMMLAALAGAAMLALAGCAGNALTAEAKLNYDGNENGSHSDKADCDADGSLAASGQVRDGSVRVTVTDGEGNQVYSESFDGAIDVSGARLDGDSGTWTLRAVRSGDDLVGDQFSGDYDFYLDCKAF